LADAPEASAMYPAMVSVLPVDVEYQILAASSEVERRLFVSDGLTQALAESADERIKVVDSFGCGDQESYNDYYCDAAGELYDKFVEAGAKVYGATSTDGYIHSESKAQRDGKFIGLMCDEDNQYDQSEDRAKAWVAQLKDEGFF